ncbi:Stress responsive alpha-beta barrel domain protein [Rhynchospora pubera]|uniref:Stress responsive alpha-beta barrel domain protein n=1 Tax=Rhynchospora pubera TaxID=906938 RepID=A0AAV8GJ18_9POAL|nr:Stress responsive alpha-beta barrel domain protein [Rhynchospora pubera]KAJ4803441.1 Stress responsive alpha-beta barrel domain protein [Rhynchospora pubera]
MLIRSQILSAPQFPSYFNSSFLPKLSFIASCNHTNRALSVKRWRNCKRNSFVISSASSSTNGAPENVHIKKRKIVEHIYLVKAKRDTSEDEEKDMLDYLYTSQYHMSGILAISLGRIEGPNAENFTHGVYMRFQRKEDVEKFYNSAFYSRVLEEHVAPISYGSISVDFESEVEDDIIPIFRRGEDFNYGVECIILISVLETVPKEAIEDALSTLQDLIEQYDSFIVQATIGTALNSKASEYSHAAVIRFPSREDFVFFKESNEYKHMWSLKFQPITKKSLLLHYSVDPVGTELM